MMKENKDSVEFSAIADDFPHIWAISQLQDNMEHLRKINEWLIGHVNEYMKAYYDRTNTE